MSHVHDSDTAYDGWCANCPEPSTPWRWRLSYWLRPYDILLDARRWRWVKSGHRRQAEWLTPERIEAIQQAVAKRGEQPK